MSDITEEDVMKYCYSRNLMLATKESLEYMHRPIVIETTNKNVIPIEWIKSKKIEYEHDRYDYVRGCFDGFNDCIDYLIDKWEKENGTDR